MTTFSLLLPCGLLACGLIGGPAAAQLKLSPHVNARCIMYVDQTTTPPLAYHICGVGGVVFDTQTSFSYSCSGQYRYVLRPDGTPLSPPSFSQNCVTLLQSFSANGSYDFAVDDNTAVPVLGGPANSTSISGGSGLLALDNNLRMVTMCVVMPLPGETDIRKCEGVHLP